MQAKLIGLLGVLWLLGALGFACYVSGAESVQAQFDAFKLTSAALAEQQEAEFAKNKAERETLRKNLEDVSAKAIPAIHARYAIELRALRADSGGVSKATPTAIVCADHSGDQRFFDALQGYRAGVLTLIEQCESQTETLKICQRWITE